MQKHRQPHVLIVEDNPINLELLADILQAEGYVVRTAGSGQEALLAVREEKPDLVLMDMRLPGMDGLEAARQIKGDPTTSDVPIIAVTAHAMAGDRAMALAAGCDDYIPKPIRIPELRRTVAKYVERIEGKELLPSHSHPASA